MELINVILVLIPVFFYLFLLLQRKQAYVVHGIPIIFSIFIILSMGFLLGISPFEEGQDKYNYMLEYSGVLEARENEIGWMLYIYILRLFFGSNYFLFFFFSAFFYTISYYVIGNRLFGKDKVGYFIIMSFGSLGFIGCGNNAIRSGIAIAIICYGLGFSSNKWIRLLLLISSVLVHKAMLLPLLAYGASLFIKNRRLVLLFWFFCLIISLVGFDLQSIFDQYSSVDERVEKYSNRMGDDDIFGKFRFDFLIYSMVPIIIANYWITKFKIKDMFYLNIYKTYILANSLWLLVIRMPQCNRVAYLSWVLIPIMTIYPLLNNLVHKRNVQRYLTIIIGMFLMVSVVLAFKDS